MIDHHIDNSFSSSQGNIAHGSEGSGPDVVLVHGTPFNSVIWHLLISQLKQDFRVHWLDLPGYGRSDKYDGQDVRLRSLARVLVEWLGYKKLNKCHLVGHDFGAAAVLGSVCVEGYQALSLSIVDGVVLNPWGTVYSLLVKQNQKVFESLPNYIHEATLRAHISTASYHLLPESIVQKLLIPWIQDGGQQAYYRQVGQYDHGYTAKLEDLYPKLQIPTRIFWGREDAWVKLGVGEKLASLIPAATLKVLPDAGHLSMLDSPGLLSQELKRWLDS
ncbi:MAG: alpha/beta hydrolase [Desulfobacterales bacterium]|nr:alpha/beta hydrolase [Desulfobacterales bacterium]